MKVLGKIGNIEIAYQQEKTNEKDQSKYWGERYTIFVEVGDDVHLVDSGFIHCQSQGGGRAILERRGIKVGAVGEMIMRYGFRNWNGRNFTECDLVKFTSFNQQQQTAQPANASEPSAEEVAAAMAEAEIEREKAVEANVESDDKTLF